MKKNDWILAAVILGIAAVIYFVYNLTGRKEADVVVIRVDDEVYGSYVLNKDQEIEINSKNVLTIKDGLAYMEWADCPDQLCMHQKPISKSNESIICLPNRVVVAVDSDTTEGLDAVSD